MVAPDTTPAPAALPLARLLGHAADALQAVRAGESLTTALARTPDAARPGTQALAFHALRWLGGALAVRTRLAPKAPPAGVDALLLTAIALLWPASEPPYAAHTLVNEAVAAARRRAPASSGFVNAVLRRFLRERAELVRTVLLQPVAQYNYPQWWIDAAKAAYPSNWQAILQAGNTQPPLTLRVNTRKTSVEDYLATLADAGLGAVRIGPSAVRLDKAVGVSAIPLFDQGYCSVQDAGAQLAAPLLDVADGMRVLDACAAPGGKTCHILELAQVDLTAIDSDPKRLERVEENLVRLGLSATLKAFEAQTKVWWDGQQFDRILADVPCTASGIVRRHPDIRWLRRKGDALQLATLSGKILDNLWQMLRPGGKLLFVTCSLWPQESEAQAAAFAVRHQATRLDAPGQLLPAGAGDLDHDGLFYALFQKNAA
jgi:16S rRNA (cytosine967-C5)-methyltransferase